jgi:hypothetical protein
MRAMRRGVATMGAMRAMRAIGRDASDAIGVATMDAIARERCARLDATEGNPKNPPRGFFDAIFYFISLCEASVRVLAIGLG